MDYKIYLMDAETGLYFAGWRGTSRAFGENSVKPVFTREIEKAQPYRSLIRMERMRARLGDGVRCITVTTAEERDGIDGIQCKTGKREQGLLS